MQGCNGSCRSGPLWILPSGAWLILPCYINFRQKGKNGESQKRLRSSRFLPFSRVQRKGIMSTVVGFIGAYALQIMHPDESRILSVLEMKRVQGIADHIVLISEPQGREFSDDGQLVALPSLRYTAPHYLLTGDLAARGADPWLPEASVSDRAEQEREVGKVLLRVLEEEELRYNAEVGPDCSTELLQRRLRMSMLQHNSSSKKLYQMVGNAVSYPLASMLGRCISMAAARKVPQKLKGEELTDPLWFLAMHEAEIKKLKCYYSQLPENDRPPQHIL
ncbi:hypothetical protein CEUSTIGMA_g10852.t1 [Chlamydomonas eustigma]|uniref:Uncharacterized protein n=1 Tax=Chlamydomonas eustigma TaxID=1157962 RepID=A0A250XK29_9CHLO|nr:hypothetical protein CEUSTIGMA_g10852.t1 [Chlamydomonas eustigma]|eukprot:GAX83427.1 hypothetical protein CEUSTIGMA_g10852.t1 [Chlamydomonas eustigma]